jgi:hypothetical protein
MSGLDLLSFANIKQLGCDKMKVFTSRSGNNGLVVSGKTENKSGVASL